MTGTILDCTEVTHYKILLLEVLYLLLMMTTIGRITTHGEQYHYYCQLSLHLPTTYNNCDDYFVIHIYEADEYMNVDYHY